MARAVYKGPRLEFGFILKMTAEIKTSKIQVEIDQFLVYRKSKVGIFIGSLIEPLLSDGQIFAKAGETCKIKLKMDTIDLSKLSTVRSLEFIIKNSCEEKNYNGSFVKQFTAISVSDYINDQAKTLNF